MRRGFLLFLFALSFVPIVLAIALPIRIDSSERAPQVAGVSTERQALESSGNELVDHLNAARVLNGRSEVMIDERLTLLADVRANDMVQNGYYSHRDQNGKLFSDRLEDVNVPKTTPACENLLLSSSNDPASAISEWVSSPDHAACMFGTDLNAIGVATIPFSSETGQQLFVAILASTQQ